MKTITTQTSNRLFKQRQTAVSIVSRAIRSKLLVRPGKCSKCAKPCKPQGHHEDYSKPLEVMWFCSKCHSAHHRGKSRPRHVLIEKVLSGEFYVSNNEKKIALTLREFQILKLLCLGIKNSEVGFQLGVSKRTAETHREHIYRFAHVTNVVQLVAWALKNKHITIEELFSSLSINTEINT